MSGIRWQNACLDVGEHAGELLLADLEGTQVAAELPPLLVTGSGHQSQQLSTSSAIISNCGIQQSNVPYNGAKALCADGPLVEVIML